MNTTKTQTLTPRDRIRIMRFFTHMLTITWQQAEQELDQDGDSIRVADAAAIADIFSRLQALEFTHRDLEDEIHSLDTEYRDWVYEEFLRTMPSTISHKVFDQTWTGYLREVKEISRHWETL